MFKFLLSLISVLFFCQLSALAQTINAIDQKPVIAVYPVWKYQSNSPSNLPWEDFTHLAIASIYPREDGSLMTTEADVFIKDAVTEAKQHGVKVIISVGGAGEGSKAFLNITTDPKRQSLFIEKLLAYIEKYDIDGIDIDWEYWTYQNELNKGGNDPVESQQLVNLMKAIKNKLAADKLLTVDIMAGYWVGEQYLSELQKYADYINLMSYDFTGAWKNSSIGHHADYKTFKKAINFVLKRGFEADKLIVGIPFYGIEFIDGKKEAIRHIDYKEIIEHQNLTTKEIQKGKIGNIYFETPELVKQKMILTNELNLAGVMIFEITADTSHDHSLLKTISISLNKNVD